MKEEICKIIEKINKRIGAVPVEKDGSYSPQNRMFVLGLYEAKEVVEKVAKEAEHGETA